MVLRRCRSILGQWDSARGLQGPVSVAGGAFWGTIDAITPNPAMARAVPAGGGDCLLAIKRDQPTLHDAVAACSGDTPPPPGLPPSR